MLYIDDIGNNTIRFGDAVGGGTYPKFLPNNMVARTSQKAGDDTTGRVWISNTDDDGNILNNYKPSDITLSGTVYTDGGAFVQAFNALMAEETLVTTTTTTAVTTTTTVPVTTTTTTTA